MLRKLIYELGARFDSPFGASMTEDLIRIVRVTCTGQRVRCKSPFQCLGEPVSLFISSYTLGLEPLWFVVNQCVVFFNGIVEIEFPLISQLHNSNGGK